MVFHGVFDVAEGVIGLVRDDARRHLARAGFDRLFQPLLEGLDRQVAHAVTRRIEIGNVAGQNLVSCLSKAHDIFQNLNIRTVDQ